VAILTPAQVAGIASQGTPSGTTVEQWVAKSRQESSHDETAVSPTGCCVGLWQVNVAQHTDKIVEARVSIENGKSAMKSGLRCWEVTKQIYAESGWRPWIMSGGKPLGPIGITMEDINAARNPDFSVVNSGGAVSGRPEEGVREGLGLSVPNPLDAIANVAEAIAAFANVLGDFFEWVSDPNTWRRAALVIGGGAVVVVGTAAIVRGTETGQKIESAVVTVATKGAAAGKTGGTRSRSSSQRKEA